MNQPPTVIRPTMPAPTRRNRGHGKETAHGRAQQLVVERPQYPIPAQLRNAPTKLARDPCHGAGYVHASRPGGDQVQCLPESFRARADLPADRQRTSRRLVAPASLTLRGASRREPNPRAALESTAARGR